VLTLMLGLRPVFGGIVRMFLAWHMREAGSRGLVVVSGIISLLLGLMIIAQWPASELLRAGHLPGHRFDLHRLGLDSDRDGR